MENPIDKLKQNQLKELDALFDLISERQLNDFGNISASNKSDGSLITSCDLWSDHQELLQHQRLQQPYQDILLQFEYLLRPYQIH